MDDRAAWMNEAALYAIWKPVSPFFFELGTLHTYGLGDDVVIDDLQGFSNIKNENMVSIQSETRLAPYLCREHKHLENMPDT